MKDGWKKSGAYTKSDCLQGSKAVSSERMKMGSGKMSGEHGTNSGTPVKGMEHASGRLGCGQHEFKSGIPKEGGK